MDDFSAARERMIQQQIIRRGIESPRLLTVLRQVPRHRFIPPESQEYAYADGPLPIGLGQTISQPYIVALMTDLLQLDGSETVLEVGTGSGYQAAILSRLAARVYTVERHVTLAEQARQILAELGCVNVQVQIGDGSLGWPAAAPYAGILVTAAAPAVPPALLDQLAPGGRLVLPVGPRFNQVLQLWQNTPAGFVSEDILPVAFVPLCGQAGWPTPD